MLNVNVTTEKEGLGLCQIVLLIGCWWEDTQMVTIALGACGSTQSLCCVSFPLYTLSLGAGVLDQDRKIMQTHKSTTESL